MTTQQRSSYWSVTINNPTQEDLEEIAQARQAGWQILGQLERGENGTTHYQLSVKSPSQCRFSAVKKRFERAHIEAARNPAALARYVTKEETRVGGLPEQSDKYPSLSKFWELIMDYYNDETKDGLDYTQLHEEVVIFYNENIDKMFTKDPLVFLDKATAHLIEDGYHVESIAANPSTRAMWNKYARSILLRSYQEKKWREIETQQDGIHDETTQRDRSTEELSQFSGSDDTQANGSEETPSGETSGFRSS